MFELLAILNSAVDQHDEELSSSSDAGALYRPIFALFLENPLFIRQMKI